MELGAWRRASSKLRSNPPSSSGSGSQTEGGAAVVIEVDTGEILAMASYPTYSLETIHEDYNELSQDPLTPLFNRAIGRRLRPRLDLQTGHGHRRAGGGGHHHRHHH